MMDLFSARLAAEIARRHGIVTVAQLLADGSSSNVIRRHVTDQLLVRVHDGVYQLASSPETFESKCVAACSADPELLVTGLSAGRLWNFRHVPRIEIPTVLVAHNRTPITSGVIVRRSNQLTDADVVLRSDGIRVAAAPRAWFDSARDVSDARFEAITEWVLDNHSTVPTLWRLTARMSQRGRPGLARVQRVMAKRGDWQKPAGSRLELRVLNALERRGIGPLLRQYAIELPNGITIHADGADPHIKWAVEVDHVTWHGGRLDAQRDKGRDRSARRVGWQVDRVTDQELGADFDSTIDDLVDLHRLRTEELRIRSSRTA